MISLKVYAKDDKRKVEKEYTAEGYELMLGTVEDFMKIIDIDKLGDSGEVAKMIAKGYDRGDNTDRIPECPRYSQGDRTKARLRHGRQETV